MRNLLSPPKRCLLLLLLLVSGSVWAQTPDDNMAFYKFITAYFGDRDSLNTIPNAISASGSGSTAIAGTRYTDTQGANIVLRHFNSSLVEEWAVQWNYDSASEDFATSVVIDDSSNIYVSGLIYEPGSPYYHRLVILKYNDSGVLQWQYIYGGTSGEPNHVYPYKLALYGQNIYICGMETDSTMIPHLTAQNDYILSPLGDSVTFSTMLLIKLNTNGTLAWRKEWDSRSYPNSVVVSGNYVYLTGYMQNDTLDSDAVIYKYNHSGIEQWNRHYSADTSTFDRPMSTITDPSDNIYVTGYARDSANGESDILALKYESNGTLGWALQYDSPDTTADDWSNDLAYFNDYIYLLGQGDTDLVILKVMADDGTPVWIKRWDGSPDTNRWYDYPYGITVNDSGTVFVGAYTSRYINYPDNAVTFVMQQYNQDGILNIENEFDSQGFQGTYHLPWILSSGWAEDTLGNVNMLVTIQQAVDTVRWEVRKFGDIRASLAENKDSVYNYQKIISRGLVSFLSDTTFINYVYDKIHEEVNPIDRTYFVDFDSIQNHIPSFYANLKAEIINNGGTTMDTLAIRSRLSEYTVNDVTYNPGVYVPYYAEDLYYYSSCWTGKTFDHVATQAGDANIAETFIKTGPSSVDFDSLNLIINVAGSPQLSSFSSLPKIHAVTGISRIGTNYVGWVPSPYQTSDDIERCITGCRAIRSACLYKCGGDLPIIGNCSDTQSLVCHTVFYICQYNCQNGNTNITIDLTSY